MRAYVDGMIPRAAADVHPRCVRVFMGWFPVQLQLQLQEHVVCTAMLHAPRVISSRRVVHLHLTHPTWQPLNQVEEGQAYPALATVAVPMTVQLGPCFAPSFSTPLCQQRKRWHPVRL